LDSDVASEDTEVLVTAITLTVICVLLYHSIYKSTQLTELQLPTRDKQIYCLVM